MKAALSLAVGLVLVAVLACRDEPLGETDGEAGGPAGGAGGEAGESPGSGSGGVASGGGVSSGGASSGGLGGDAGSESGGKGPGGSGGDGATSGAGMGGSAGTAEPPDAIQFQFDPFVLSGARRTVDFAFVPGTDDEVLVLGHHGLLHHFRLEEDAAVRLNGAELTGTFQAKGCGANSLALDPLFQENQLLYVSRCLDLVTTSLTRYQLRNWTGLADSEAEVLSVVVSTDRDEWHRFGSMGFESDGETLWVLLGDLFYPEHAQDTSRKNGSLLRIIPNRDPSGAGYETAFGNAFVDDPGRDPDIYIYGIRSPWRGSRDRFGRFWIGDVGHQSYEEVNLATEPGQNFGWDNHEGPCREQCEGIREPLIAYGRGQGVAVWVGEMYEEPSVERYHGLARDTVFYGDFYSGWIRGITVNEHGTLKSNELFGELTDITQWRVGPDGSMYALTLNARLHRVRAVPSSP